MNVKLNFLVKAIKTGLYIYSLKSFKHFPKGNNPSIRELASSQLLTIPEQPPAQEVINGCFREFYGKYYTFPNITDH